MVDIQEQSWSTALSGELSSAGYASLSAFVEHEYETATVYPSRQNIFAALEATPLSSVKVVIVGQDPYHGPGQAQGLSFSVPAGLRFPPSLRNIFKELSSDLGIAASVSGDLSPWTREGVLLLNAVLTVRSGEPGSHAKRGWESLTDAVIRAVSSKSDRVVFMLWGAYAQKKAELVDDSKHCILTAAHPSPLSAYNGFFGCRHFSSANAWLSMHGVDPVDWTLSAVNDDRPSLSL